MGHWWHFRAVSPAKKGAVCCILNVHSHYSTTDDDQLVAGTNRFIRFTIVYMYVTII